MKLNRRAIERLQGKEREEAEAALAAYTEGLKGNPLYGYRPHPKQHQFHSSSAQLKAFLGGNRSGKTTAGVLDDIIQAVDAEAVPQHLQKYKHFEPPFHCRLVAPGEDLMEGVIYQKLREWCPKSQLVGDSFERAYQKSRAILHFKNGSFFDFLTYGQDLDKFGGTAKHRIHYDEEPPKDIWEEGRMRLLDYKGADQIFTMTPQQGMSWMYWEIYEAWEKGELPNALLLTVDMDDNPHLDQKQKEMLLRGLPREVLEARKQGRFVHFHGMIYPEFSKTRHVVPEVDGVPPNSKVYRGIDPGIRHMAAVVWTYLTPDDLLVVFDELALQGKTVANVAEQIKVRDMRWGTQDKPLRVDWSVIDPAARNIMHQTGRSDQMEFADHGIITILGQNSVSAGINRVKERLERDRLVIGANCQTLIEQFRRYRWSTPKKIEDDPQEKPIKTDDHMLDALRYVVMSRPYSEQIQPIHKPLRPLEQAMMEEISGKRNKSIPKTPEGGIFA